MEAAKYLAKPVTSTGEEAAEWQFRMTVTSGYGLFSMDVQTRSTFHEVQAAACQHFDLRTDEFVLKDENGAVWPAFSSVKQVMEEMAAQDIGEYSSSLF